MNMLANLMGGLIDKEEITRTTISETIKNLSVEFNCPTTDLFIMIKPKKDEENFTCWVYKLEQNSAGVNVPACKRELTLKEILGIDAG